MTHGTLRLEPRSGFYSSEALESNARVEAFTELYTQTYFALRTVSDLSPRNEAAHGKLRELMEAASYPFTSAQVDRIFDPAGDAPKKAPEMRAIVAKGLRDTEIFWSKNLTKAQLPDFCRVGLFRDYVEQVDNEMRISPVGRMVTQPTEKILVVGAGALALDAIALFERTNRLVTCIDSDWEVVEAQRHHISRMGYAKAIQCHHASSGMYGIEGHPYIIINSVKINDARVWETLSNPVLVDHTEGFADHIAVREGDGVGAALYECLSQSTAENFQINQIANRFVGGTPTTMQSTQYANLSGGPKSTAKMTNGIGDGETDEAFIPLQRLIQDQLRPGKLGHHYAPG